jgi:T5SS/PEP-CTERM-associated repeat protein
MSAIFAAAALRSNANCSAFCSARRVARDVLLVTVAIAANPVATGWAADRFYVGPASGGGAVWNNGANWSLTSGGAGGAGVPGSGDVARIVNSDATSRDVTLDATTTIQELRLGNSGLGTNSLTQPNPVNLNVNGSVLLGAGANEKAVFTQQAGANIFAATDFLGQIILGDGAGSNATYHLQGGSLYLANIFGNLSIGPNGTGSFNQTGGSVDLEWSMLLGLNASGVGNYTLADGRLSVSGNQIIGHGGTAIFTQTGGTNTVGDPASAGLMILARQAGSNATYTLSGGALDVVLGSVYVGGDNNFGGGAGVFNVSGTGNATIANTLKVWNTAGTAVNLSGGTLQVASLDTNGNPSRFNWTGGTLNITGAGGLMIGASGPLGANVTVDSPRQLNVTNNLTVASGGTLRIESGGSVSAYIGEIADVAASSGAVTVTGPGSNWNTSGYLDVGQVGPGTLLIENGASVSNLFSVIGRLGGSSGMATVTGTGSTWTDVLGLTIGYFLGSSGTLAINDGGSVSSNLNASIGRRSGSTGVVTVTGPGSTWTITGRLAVGGDAIAIASGGTGTLSIAPGGTVSVDEETVIYPQGLVQLQGGTLNLNGDTTLDGGTLTKIGNLNLAAGRTLTAQNNAQIDLGNTIAWLSTGTSWNINSGSDLISTSLVRIGHSAGTTTVTVDGVGSSFNVGGDIWGSDGTANVTFRNEATANINGGIGLAFGPAAGVSGTINVESDADVVMSHLQINNLVGSSDSSGTVTVTGTGSTLTQSGGAGLIVGRASGGTATINVTDSGNYTTGAGLTQVNATGLIDINGGTFDVRGDITIDGGSIVRTSGNLVLAAGRTLTAQNNAQIDLGLNALLGGGTTWNINSGADLSASGQLDIGFGGGVTTVTVDGSGTSATLPGGFWGFSGNTANVTIRNGATASFVAIFMATSDVAGTAATLNVESGADVTIGNNVNVATSGGATTTGAINVTGVGSTLTHNDFDLTLGHATSGVATLSVTNGSVFTSGRTTTVRATGTINLASGATFDARGPITLSGGAFNFLGGTLHVGTFNGSLLNQGGKLAPGHSAGTTTITGNYTQQSTARLEIEIGGPAAFDSDIVNVSGTASLGGQLQLALINSFEPIAGQTFSVMQAGSLTGTFNNVPNGKRLVTNGGLGSFVVSYGPGSAFPNQVRLTDFQPSPTGLVAYEPFDYSPAGADLLGANGGSGFAAAWVNRPSTPVASNFDIAAGSLSFMGLSTTGNRVTTDALASNTGITRELSIPLGAPDTTSYLSFIVRPEDVLGQGQFGGFFGIYLGASTGNELFVGKPGSGQIFALEDVGGANQHSSGVSAVIDEEFLLVVRADFSDGNDQFTLYVNPTPGGAEPLSGTIKNDSDVGTVRNIGILSSGAFSIDELRIGASYADVVPAGLPGDYNNDGKVDAADYVVWRKNEGTTNMLPNDPIGGTIGPAQFDQWRANFGATIGSGAANHSVPEPAAIVLALMVFGAMRHRSSRRDA